MRRLLQFIYNVLSFRVQLTRRSGSFTVDLTWNTAYKGFNVLMYEMFGYWPAPNVVSTLGGEVNGPTEDNGSVYRCFGLDW